MMNKQEGDSTDDRRSHHGKWSVCNGEFGVGLGEVEEVMRGTEMPDR